MIEFDVPVVQAPMAGGPSTPALAAAVSNAGGLGFLAAGYKTPEAVHTEIAATRELTQQPFGVNVFAPPNGPADPAIVQRFADRLRDQAAGLGVQLGDPRFDDDHYQQKVELLTQERVPVVSFTFGCPTPAVVQQLQTVGTSVWVTVTDPQEALLAADAGVDALVVQGIEAGGHRGSFDDADTHEDYGLLALLSLTRRPGRPSPHCCRRHRHRPRPGRCPRGRSLSRGARHRLPPLPRGRHLRAPIATP